MSSRSRHGIGFRLEKVILKRWHKRIKMIAFAVVFSNFTKGRSKRLFRNAKMFSSQNIGEYGCVGSDRSRG